MEDPRTVDRSTPHQSGPNDRTLIVRARPVRLSRKMTVEEAFRVTVLECLAQVSANTPAVIQSRDIEGLHQMRVGLRRLHVALDAFGDEFKTPALKDLRKRTKAFTDTIAPARDLDVFLTELFEGPAAAGGRPDAFAILKERAERARKECWEQAVAAVGSQEFSIFLDDAAMAAETHSWFGVGGMAFKTRFAADAPIGPTAARALHEHLVRVRKRGRHMRELDEHSRHRLRIALKKLRYAAEFFAPLYKKAKVKGYTRRVKLLLDDLGALNDVATVRGTLTMLTHDEDGRRWNINPDIHFAAGAISGWHSERAQRLGESAVEHWRKFKKLEPFWG